MRQAGEGLKVTLGEYRTAGYWSGEGMTFSRARADYDCHCGNPAHKIKKGDVYFFITPDRLAATHGVKYKNLFHVAHVNWHVIVLDRKGNVVAEYNKP
jgi:hypothetical protein